MDYRRLIEDYIYNINNIEASINNDKTILADALIKAGQDTNIYTLYNEFLNKGLALKRRGFSLLENTVLQERDISSYEHELADLFKIQSEILKIFVGVLNKDTATFGFPGNKGLSSALVNSIEPCYVEFDIIPLEKRISKIQSHIDTYQHASGIVLTTSKNLIKVLGDELAIEKMRETMQTEWNKYNIRTIVNDVPSILSYIKHKEDFMSDEIPIPPPCQPRDISFQDINRYNYLVCLENWLKNAGVVRISSNFPQNYLVSRNKFIGIISNKTTLFYNALYMFDCLFPAIGDMDEPTINKYMILCNKLSSFLYRTSSKVIADTDNKAIMLDIFRCTKFVGKFPTVYDFLNYYNAGPEAYELLNSKFINVEYNSMASSEVALICMKMVSMDTIEYSINAPPLKPDPNHDNDIDLVIDTECENKTNIGGEEVDVLMGEKIGEGGFGQVYLVEIMGVKYVKKVILIKSMMDWYMTLKEIITLRSLNHENVIKIKSIQVDKNLDTIEIYLEYVGRDIPSYLSVLTYEQKVKILKRILKGLKYLHENGVVHNDLKLQNVVLDEKNDYNPKLIDFGLVSLVENSPAIIYQGGGTRGFMSPERESKLPSDYRSDMYSVGVMMGRLLGMTKSRLGEYGKDLYDKLIDYDINSRITMNEALAHPFFNII